MFKEFATTKKLSFLLVLLFIATITSLVKSNHALAASCPDSVPPNPPGVNAIGYVEDQDAVVAFFSWGGDHGDPTSCPDGVGFCNSNNRSSNTNEMCTNKPFGYRVKGTADWEYKSDLYFRIPCAPLRSQNVYSVAIEAQAFDADVITPRVQNKSDIISTPHASCPNYPPGECKALGCKKQGGVWVCDSTVDECKAGFTCPTDFKIIAEQAFVLTYPPGKIPSNCTQTSPSPPTYDCVFTNICTKATVPPSGKQCTGKGKGVCSIENGLLVDKCCFGFMPRVDGNNCECDESKDAVIRLYGIIGGIMIPVSIIIGMFLIVLKGYKIMTSQGDPAKLQEGKEGLTSAIIGLIFVVMAVSILRVIIKSLISGDTDPF